MSEKSVDMPEGVEVRQEGTSLAVKGPKGELSRDFGHPKVKAEVRGSKVTFTSEDDRKKNSALLGTFAAHISNMAKGVTSGWECRLSRMRSVCPWDSRSCWL